MKLVSAVCRVVEAQWGHLSKETWLIISKGRIRIQVGLSTKFMPFPSTLQKHPEGKGQVRGWLLSVQRGSAEELPQLGHFRGLLARSAHHTQWSLFAEGSWHFFQS